MAEALLYLCSLLKKALAYEQVELVMLNAGVFRAKRDYDVGPFTKGNLWEEFATRNLQRVVDLPGAVIADAIHETRSRPKPAAGFLHVDGSAKVDDEHVLTCIDGRPCVADRMYKVCTNFVLLDGIDNIQPLMRYQDKHLEKGGEETLRRARDIILQCCQN